MNRCLTVLFALWVAFALPAQRADENGSDVSPFRAMRAVDRGIEVQVDDDTWWALDAVAGVETPKLLREASRLAGRKAWKRLTEDLPALLEDMGAEVGDRVDLSLRDLQSGKVVQRKDVAMTRENRQRLWQANVEAERARGRSQPRRETAPRSLGAADAHEDFETLRELLDTAFAYRTLRGVDLDALLRTAEAEFAGGEPTVERFTVVVDRVLRAFGDGHSRIDDVPPPRAGFLPFLVQQVDGGHAAFHGDRSGLLDDRYPFLVAIDGVPLAKWLGAAEARGTQGSAAMRVREAERGLRFLGELRAAMGQQPADSVRVTLSGKAGTKTRTLPIAPRPSAYGAWPRTATRRLGGDIGYLRIDQMRGDDEFLAGLDAAMQSFRDTRGLVIDVRGNGGGTRDALRRLAPYFLPANGGPVVGNVAAVLLDDGKAAGPTALADRGLYPADWSGWTDAQRTAITQFARTFRPSWQLPNGKFSPFCFLVLDRSDNENAFAYDKPVAVLIDRACFSATDVFAAALGALPNVRLVGESTSGGSGRAKGHVLPNSGVRLQLSTMASFRPDGVLFEGNGVVPDLAVAAQPGDLVGASDAVLDAAVQSLR